MRTQIKTVIAEVLGISPDAIADDASTETVAEWDSLKHLELMMAIEAAFNTRINTAAMLELHSIDAIESYISAQHNR
ncbi:MAG TPA: acyl carrier protein [Pirellulales bacterium]|nr:acyl carrier protein [Pirellulales bacterium]